MNYLKDFNLKGMFGWSSLWWKAGCGCMGYGELLLFECGDKGSGAVCFKFAKNLDMERCVLGSIEVVEMGMGDRLKLLEGLTVELELGVLAKEILTILRKVGKLTGKRERERSGFTNILTKGQGGVTV